MMDQTWKVPNSKGGEPHTVTLKAKGGYLHCTCKGYFYRKICRHVTDIEKTLPGGRTHAALLAAIGFHNLGYHVIPVQAGGKCPMVRWLDYQSKKPTMTQICEWWQKWPNANVGLVLGNGRIVIDLDGGDEAEALLAEQGMILPASAPRVRTRSGYHVYLSAPGFRGDRIGLYKAATPLADASLTPKGKLRHAQVDVRGLGIIIAPPSVHASGHVYEWLVPLTADLPEAPAALMTRLTTPAPKPVKPTCTKDGCDKPVGYRIRKGEDGKRGRQYLPFCREHELALAGVLV